MDLSDLCAAKWGSVAAAERAIDIGSGMLRSISAKGSTTTRTLRKIMDALEPSDGERRAILVQFGLMPAIVNSGVTGTGDLAWPGAWIMDDDGDWSRHWLSGDDEDIAVTESVFRPYADAGDAGGGLIVAHLGGYVSTAADARRADAILAKLCAGPDPYPYPAELLATDGGEG